MDIASPPAVVDYVQALPAVFRKRPIIHVYNKFVILNSTIPQNSHVFKLFLLLSAFTPQIKPPSPSNPTPPSVSLSTKPSQVPKNQTSFEPFQIINSSSPSKILSIENSPFHYFQFAHPLLRRRSHPGADPRWWVRGHVPPTDYIKFMCMSTVSSSTRRVIFIHIFPGWKFTSNHNTDNDRRIIIIRKDTVNVQVMHQSRQAITCSVTIPGDHRFMFTAVYISNQRGERKLLLEDLD
ncbi:hypothetical protein YC2023_077501 [Brassica napus]